MEEVKVKTEIKNWTKHKSNVGMPKTLTELESVP